MCLQVKDQEVHATVLHQLLEVFCSLFALVFYLSCVVSLMLLVSVVMLFGLPSVMEGDHGNFGEKSSHLKLTHLVVLLAGLVLL
jgi:hypothetical protein